MRIKITEQQLRVLREFEYNAEQQEIIDYVKRLMVSAVESRQLEEDDFIVEKIEGGFKLIVLGDLELSDLDDVMDVIESGDFKDRIQMSPLNPESHIVFTIR